ncbi:pentatricopeptide repeat-containing protein [Klebsormidium nitens]|uniref:Pentatricopeptide repeat-containing protein n=1 Tax=Klebsormidium nitens TaxID=105231 RepID=A0A1Y1HZ09_KLENI|nr:pentatricopeptide repeat-containing protein [Klebsormidium nitens]|eukprot:GAQ82429.1 pentatricopeptide repeat-containing protein [Klebsormidium nitens]
MAGPSAELARRSLALQEHSLRVLSQLLPQVFSSLGPLNQGSISEDFAHGHTGATSHPANGSLSFLGFHAPRPRPSALSQVRQFTGLAATAPACQEYAYATSENSDTFENGSIDGRTRSRGSAVDGGGGRSWAKAALAEKPKRFGVQPPTAGNGAGWTGLDDAPSAPPSPITSEEYFAKSRKESHSFASSSGDAAAHRHAEEPRMSSKAEARRGKVHWVEIDANDGLKARDCYGTQVDPRLDKFLETSREELEAYRLRELAERRNAGHNGAPFLAEYRWPDKFQVAAAAEAGEKFTSPWRPETPAAKGGVKPKNSAPSPKFRTVSMVEDYLEKLLAMGQYEEVPKEFSTYKYWCQSEYEKVSDRLTGKMYTSVLLAFLHSKADLNRCLRLHEEMRKHGIVPSCLHYNTLLKVALQDEFANAKAATELVDEMQELGVAPDHDTYNTAALVCSWGKYSMTAHRYVTEMLAKGLMPPPRTLQEVLISHIRSIGEGSKRTEEAGALLKVMLAQDIAIKTFMVQEVLTACIDQDDAKTAALCINLLHKRSHVLDEGTLTAALHTAARRGDVDLMQLAWAGLLKAVGEPSPAAHLARLHALTVPRPSQGGIPLERLFQELAQLEESLGPRLAEMDPEEADLVLDPAKSYKWLIARLSRRLKALDKAYYVLTVMHDAGQRVPLLGLNCIIQGCVNVRDMSRAFQTFDEIQRTFKLEPDVHSYNAILDGCGQARQVAATVRTFELMEASGVTSNKRSWELLVSAHVINRNPAKALVTLQDMVNRGFVPDKAVLDGLLRRSRRENYELGITTVVKLMEALGFQEDPKAVERRSRIGEVLSEY